MSGGAHSRPVRELPPVLELELAPSDDFAIYAYAPHLLLPPSSSAKPMSSISAQDVDEADYDNPDSPFCAPYRLDSYAELPVVDLHDKAKAALEAHIDTVHQEELMRLIRGVTWCPEPLPFFLHPNCPANESELVRGERIHAVVQLISQLRESQHQALLRRVYKAFGADHRRAAKELYTRELFPTAFIQYHSLYACLSCDTCLSLAPDVRHNTTVDLLEKLAITCLRAAWPADAAHYATAALKHDPHSTRARVWLATAHLALGDLQAAATHLVRLPARGAFPPTFPAWIERRVQAQRAVLTRLEREATGAYDRAALSLDPPHTPPPGPHFTHVAPTVLRSPRGALRTRAAVARGALLLVAHPIACSPCCTGPGAAPGSLHAEDPALLTHARLADGLYTQARALPAVRAALRTAAATADVALTKAVGNPLRAAAIHVAQTFSVPIPGVGMGKHAAHAVFLPLVALRGAGPANTTAVFCGPHLFLHAARDLAEGVALAFDGFDRAL